MNKSALRLGRYFLLVAFFTSAMTFGAQQSVAQSPVKEVRIRGGETADVWLGVNVKGKVYYTIRTRDGTNKLRMWWITEPLGRVKQLGVREGSGSLDVPGKLSGSLSAKLRGKATNDTIVYVRENAAIDSSVGFKW